MNVSIKSPTLISLNLFANESSLNNQDILSDTRQKSFDLSQEKSNEDSSKLKKDWINPITYKYTKNFVLKEHYLSMNYLKSHLILVLSFYLHLFLHSLKKALLFEYLSQFSLLKKDSLLLYVLMFFFVVIFQDLNIFVLNWHS